MQNANSRAKIMAQQVCQQFAQGIIVVLGRLLDLYEANICIYNIYYIYIHICIHSFIENMLLAFRESVGQTDKVICRDAFAQNDGS